jgi:N-acyl-phosphatidylethanolamine-hydrolysing phospholipase D
LDWWQNCHFINAEGKTAEVIFCPTKHWTARGFCDRNTCLWGAFAVRSGNTKFFFSGDTAYCEVFKLIGDKLGPFDVSAIPIGAYSPRWFMKDEHCNPNEAVKIHQDLRSKQSIAIHWGTYPMTDEDKIEPALELARARDLVELPTDKMFTLAHGETWIVGDQPRNDLATKYPYLYGKYLESKRHESASD